ncbi:2-oxo acid dehydrogenase subunit E2 [Candidatus Micrarchaeota archaeon]|nr:2-oxo acid dehydrogenase subunit E2 [Candidatus Micrarchaeota archaeon]
MPTILKFPDVGEGIAEGVIVKWLVKEGDMVNSDQPVAEIETDKAVVEIPSPRSGKVLKLHSNVGDTIKVGNPLITVGDEGEKLEAPKEEKKIEAKAMEENPKEVKPEPKQQEMAQQDLGRILATPSTRRLARELNVDITKVTGTGSGGRISDEDIRNFSKAPKTASQPQTQVKTPKTIIEIAEGEQVERVPISHMRKVISETMSRSAFTIPQVTHMDEADVTELVAVREREKVPLEQKGIKLTYLSFIAKAVLSALKEYPKFNSVFDSEKNELILKKSHNIGIAADTPEGLVVFVIKNIDSKSILEIAKEMQKLSEEARSRKISLSDLKGGTFTITNIGSLGGLFATPIINPPEVAILGLGKIKDRLVMLNNQIQNRKILYLSLTFDHRAIDGAEAARFTNTIIKHLEDPNLMLVDVV